MDNNPLVARLSLAAPLDEADRDRLRALAEAARPVPARTELAREGEPADRVHVVLEGVACRARVTEDGRRSIVALILPGDFCDLEVLVLRRMDHTVATLGACRIARLPVRAVRDVMAASPRIAHALLWSALVNESVLREWLLSAGRRRADRRLAHLLCELHARLEVVGQASATGFALPLTQEELADALGLSTAHAQRALGALREADLAELRERRVVIPDLPALRAFAGFDPGYLHLDEAAPEAAG